MKEKIMNKRRQIIGYVDKKLNGEYIIYNKVNARIGIIKPTGTKLTAYDRLSRKIAYWDERTDYTYDDKMRKIGKGNLLIGLYFIDED